MCRSLGRDKPTHDTDLPFSVLCLTVPRPARLSRAAADLPRRLSGRCVGNTPSGNTDRCTSLGSQSMSRRRGRGRADTKYVKALRLGCRSARFAGCRSRCQQRCFRPCNAYVTERSICPWPVPDQTNTARKLAWKCSSVERCSICRKATASSRTALSFLRSKRSVGAASPAGRIGPRTRRSVSLASGRRRSALC